MLACIMYLIGIAGPSGSGKTELARMLARLLEAPVISLDSYYRDLSHLPFDERCGTNFDDPDVLEHELLALHLRALLEGSHIDKPVYDFTLHVRHREVEHVAPGRFAIVEGLWSALGTKVYVHAEDEVCFERRLARDIRERGRSPESVQGQYAATVRPMAALYILPQRDFADVVVSGTEPLRDSAAAVLSHIFRHTATPGEGAAPPA
jgi:uridine kinase